MWKTLKRPVSLGDSVTSKRTGSVLNVKSNIMATQNQKETELKYKDVTRGDVLLIERGKAIKELTELEIDICVLERTPPETVVVKRQVTENSYVQITAKQMLEQCTKDQKNTQTRLGIIESLLKSKPKK